MTEKYKTDKPLLGVLGGMGPLATALFLEHITNFTPAEKDQDHLDIILYSMPSIPERTDYILGKTSKSPLPWLIKYINELKDRQVDLVAIPCVTAMYFYDQLCNLGVEVTDISKIALDAVSARFGGFARVGIMATSGTVSSRLFERGTKNKYILPDEKYQNMIMEVIYTAIKSGKGFCGRSFNEIINHLKEKGVDVIILGCTELSLVKRHMQLDENLFVDALSELAKYSVRRLV